MQEEIFVHRESGVVVKQDEMNSLQKTQETWSVNLIDTAGIMQSKLHDIGVERSSILWAKNSIGKTLRLRIICHQ